MRRTRRTRTRIKMRKGAITRKEKTYKKRTEGSTPAQRAQVPRVQLTKVRETQTIKITSETGPFMKFWLQYCKIKYISSMLWAKKALFYYWWFTQPPAKKKSHAYSTSPTPRKNMFFMKKFFFLSAPTDCRCRLTTRDSQGALTTQGPGCH